MTGPKRTPPHWPIATATGHRPEKIPAAVKPWTREKITACVRWLYTDCGTRTFICGMARGTDMWFGAAALEVGMDLWAYIPCETQADPWKRNSPADVAEWERLRAAAVKERERVFAPTYSRACMFARNDGMLEDADAVMCVWRPTLASGGTFHAIRRAHDMGLPGMHIDPDARQVSWDLPSLARP